VTPEIAERLQSLDIQTHTQARGYYLFVRDNCAAFAHERDGAVALGSSGIMTEEGLAFLIWREERPYLSAHGASETPAQDEQVAAMRQFAEDLKAALNP
jgi:hypothetical protein